MKILKIIPVMLLGVASIAFSAGAFAVMQTSQNPVSDTLDAAGNLVTGTATGAVDLTADTAGGVVEGANKVVDGSVQGLQQMGNDIQKH
jgi:hypothetical protein